MGGSILTDPLEVESGYRGDTQTFLGSSGSWSGLDRHGRQRRRQPSNSPGSPSQMVRTMTRSVRKGKLNKSESGQRVSRGSKVYSRGQASNPGDGSVPALDSDLDDVDE